MTITICASMVFAEKMLAVKKELEKIGHKIYISDYAIAYQGKTRKEIVKSTIYDKIHQDAIRNHWRKIKKSQAILVLNYDRKGISNYIGGNTLLEIGFAYILHKKIFLLNPIPSIDFYRSEIVAVKPVILNGDLKKIK